MFCFNFTSGYLFGIFLTHTQGHNHETNNIDTESSIEAENMSH